MKACWRAREKLSAPEQPFKKKKKTVIRKLRMMCIAGVTFLFVASSRCHCVHVYRMAVTGDNHSLATQPKVSGLATNRIL